MSDDVFDAVIVGAGPAGCSAATTLAQSGARVALFEAHHSPHDKLCGEFLSPECADLLDDLGMTARLQTLHPVPIRAIRFATPDSTCWETQLPRAGWGLSRRALDTSLATGAAGTGVRMFEGTTVTNIRGNLTGGFQVDTERGHCRARVVLAAHGKRAALDRALGRAFLRQPQPFVALKAHFRGPALGNRVELHTFPGGYCGLAEIEDCRVNVCLLVREPVFRAASHGENDPVRSFLMWMRRQNARLDTWLAGAEPLDPHWMSIAQIPFGLKPTVEHEILMVGDAGGLIAPLAGDGIAMALKSGLIAANLCTGFLAGAFSAAELTRRYAAHWEHEFGPRLRLGRLLQPILLQPRLAPLALRLVRTTPALGRYLVAHTRDPQST